jgi:hypothetical protein
MKFEKSHEHYNIQSNLVENLANRIFFAEEKLSEAYNGKAKSFRQALGSIVGLKNKLVSLNLGHSKSDMELIKLNIEISRKLESINCFEEGTNYLWDGLNIIVNIFKDNDMVFPKRTKGMSFKKFIESETK